ncbi:MAG: SurA N-terminal domain-containing protein [Rhodospirillales bacterium]|nr:MAG: SurA N-terminal domain-containing protein [Rhodospirillales bacterium]
MLQQLRSSAASLVAKLLVVLLIISFAAWGVTDYITQVQEADDVATVGDDAISTTELSEAFQRELNRFRAQGIELSAEQARSLGLLDQVLDRLISARVYELGGDMLGMAVSDGQVRSIIAEEPSFFDETGRFSRARYEFALRQAGLSEGQFVSDVRRDILRRQIINSFDFPDDAPDSLVTTLHRWRGEKRVASVAVVPVDATLDVGEPDTETLQALYQERADQFTAPERRRINYLHVTRELAMREIIVTEEQTRQYYDANLADFTQDERRKVQQVLVADEASARQVAAAVGEGRTFATVAREIAGQDAAALELGMFTAAEFPVPELWDTVAGLAEGAISPPQQSPFGWHVFRVTEVIPESIMPFDEARGEIEERLRIEQSAEVLYDLSRALEDELAGGATLEEAAATLDIPLRRTEPLDLGGVGANGQPVDDLPGGDFLDMAFLTETGEMSRVTQLPEGDYYLLRIDESIPSALRPLEEVRDEVANTWKADRRREAARTRALAIVTRLENGESLSDLAAAEGLTAQDSKPFDRRGGGAESRNITPLLASDLFKVELGQPAMDESPEGFIVAQLKAIEPADLSEPGELSTVLANQMMSDVLIQFNNALRERFGVTIDRAALNRF